MRAGFDAACIAVIEVWVQVWIDQAVRGHQRALLPGLRAADWGIGIAGLVTDVRKMRQGHRVFGNEIEIVRCSIVFVVMQPMRVGEMGVLAAKLLCLWFISSTKAATLPLLT